MKKEMTSFDIAVMSAELQKLIGSYIDKIYQPEADRLHFRFNLPQGKENLIIDVGKWIYLNPTAEPSGKALAYGMFLRKYLMNGRVSRIQQHRFDRIIEIVVDRRGEFHLILEMFGRGNVILAKDGMILQPLHSKSWSGRELRAHREYLYPPERVDTPRLGMEEILSVISSSNRDIVRALAVDLNLGGLYAEELCLRADVEKHTPANELDSDALSGLISALKNLMDEMSQPTPTVVFDNDVPADVVPTRLQKYENIKQKERETLSEALCEFITSRPVEIKDERVAKLERRKTQQEKAMQRHRVRAEESHEIAEFLYTQYEPIERVIKTLRSGESPSDVEVISKDPKRRAAVLNIEDREIEIHYEEDVNANAQRYYRKEKNAKSKIRSLERAIEDTEKELLLTERSEKKKAKKREPTKALWVDRFRWFISSENFLVIGGRDAKSNEKIVKKHLKAGDRYVHAEISGAPSVVIKKGSQASEETLREACQFAVCFSKAWSKGLASGSAYWVTPEQVSKRAESGEYLPRGGFVVRGKRNYCHKLPLEVAVGEINYEGTKKIVCGPLGALKNRSETIVTLKPGKENPNEVAKDLGEAFDVPVEEILRILPPGSAERVG